MRIISVEAATCVVPLEGGIAFATRAVQERHYTLVRVRSDSGGEGVGFCYAGHKGGGVVTLAVRDLLADVAVGEDPHRTEAIWDAMYRETLLHGRRGSVIRAISAVDMALWDLVSREAGLPLHRYLGGYLDETVPAYASGGYYAEGKTPDDLCDEMRRYVEMGFDAVKIKVGRVPPVEDAVRVRAAREAVGPNVPLFLDANNAWPDAMTAIQAVRHFEEYEPGWIEEPLMPDDIRGHAEIAAAVSVPVATGEIHATRWEFQQIVDAGAADILQADAGVCGGGDRVAKDSGHGGVQQPGGCPPLARGPACPPRRRHTQRHLGGVLPRLHRAQHRQALQHCAGGAPGRAGPAEDAGPRCRAR